MIKDIKVSVPAKCILFGEYAVVEGWPGIAFSIPEFTTTIIISFSDHFEYKGASEDIIRELCELFHVNAQIQIQSTIPMGVGLGSSAAFLVALITALSEYSGIKVNLFQMAWEWEHRLHNGKSSGLDIAACIAGMKDLSKSVVIKYQKGNYEVLNLSLPQNLCIYDSCIKRVVKEVDHGKDSLKSLGEFTERFLRNGSLEKLIKEANEYLDKLGVVPSELKEKLAGLYWKMTGAGKGGCFIVLHSGESSVPLTNIRLIWRSSPL